MSERPTMALRASVELDRLLPELIDPLVVTDNQGIMVRTNPALERLLHRPESELLGRPLRSFFSGNSPVAAQPFWTGFAGACHELETEVVTASGARTPVLFSGLRCEETGRIVGILRDITERNLAREEISRLAYYDPLTGLPNRLLFLNRLEQAILQGKRDYIRKEGFLALLYLDLDDFKAVNDTLGHTTGDQLLVSVAGRLKEALRAGDTLARLGGDEFVVILPRISRPEDAARVAEKALASIAEPGGVGGHEIYAPASVGIAVYPDDGEDAGTLMRHADIAMYSAKGDGPNTCRFYTEKLNRRTRQQLLLCNRLRNAVGSLNGFTLHFQVQVDAHARPVGAEALLRWQDAELGNITPDRFIPVAEKTGLILPLGEWVLRTACSQAAKWRAAGLPSFKVAINLSARQFREATLPETLAAILAETDADPADIELEITETALIDRVEETIDAMHRLKALGCSLAIDDFGIGYSSLSYLKRFPVDTLKIDRSFVRGIGESAKDDAIITAIAAMAHHLEMQVVCEGVESEAQFDFLRGIGCEQFQGELFSMPLPAGDFPVPPAAPQAPAEEFGQLLHDGGV